MGSTLKSDVNALVEAEVPNLGDEYTPEEMDSLIAQGLDDIERGDVIDGDEGFRQLRAYAEERRRSA